MIFERALVASLSDKQGDLLDIFSYIDQQCGSGDWKELEAAFNRIEPGQVTDAALICWLRASYSAREFIPNYNDLVERSFNYFTDKGKDGKSILKGLLDFMDKK